MTSPLNKLKTAAAHRREVMLPDGSTGLLMYVGPEGGAAKVKVGNHHRRVRTEDLTVMSTHAAPRLNSGVLPCCGATIDATGPRDRVTVDPARVTCPGAVN